jgi:hypothetical protein
MGGRGREFAIELEIFDSSAVPSAGLRASAGSGQGLGAQVIDC